MASEAMEETKVDYHAEGCILCREERGSMTFTNYIGGFNNGAEAVEFITWLRDLQSRVQAAERELAASETRYTELEARSKNALEQLALIATNRHPEYVMREDVGEMIQPGDVVLRKVGCAPSDAREGDYWSADNLSLNLVSHYGIGIATQALFPGMVIYRRKGESHGSQSTSSAAEGQRESEAAILTSATPAKADADVPALREGNLAGTAVRNEFRRLESPADSTSGTELVADDVAPAMAAALEADTAKRFDGEFSGRSSLVNTNTSNTPQHTKKARCEMANEQQSSDDMTRVADQPEPGYFQPLKAHRVAEQQQQSQAEQLEPLADPKCNCGACPGESASECAECQPEVITEPSPAPAEEPEASEQERAWYRAVKDGLCSYSVIHAGPEGDGGTYARGMTVQEANRIAAYLNGTAPEHAQLREQAQEIERLKAELAGVHVGLRTLATQAHERRNADPAATSIELVKFIHVGIGDLRSELQQAKEEAGVRFRFIGRRTPRPGDWIATRGDRCMNPSDDTFRGLSLVESNGYVHEHDCYERIATPAQPAKPENYRELRKAASNLLSQAVLAKASNDPDWLARIADRCNALARALGGTLRLESTGESLKHSWDNEPAKPETGKASLSQITDLVREHGSFHKAQVATNAPSPSLPAGDGEADIESGKFGFVLVASERNDPHSRYAITHDGSVLDYMQAKAAATRLNGGEPEHPENFQQFAEWLDPEEAKKLTDERDEALAQLAAYRRDADAWEAVKKWDIGIDRSHDSKDWVARGWCRDELLTPHASDPADAVLSLAAQLEQKERT